MPIYDIHIPRVEGNAVDGFEVKDQRSAGEIYIPPTPQGGGSSDVDVVELLAEAGKLSRRVNEAYERGEIEVDFNDGSIAISELERGATVWNRRREVRALDVSDRLLREGQEAVQAEAEWGRLNLKDDEAATDIEVVTDFRPILFLDLQEQRIDDVAGVAIWSTELRQSPVDVARITVGYADDKIGVDVEVTLEDRPEGADTFEWYLADWQKRPTFGFDPVTRDELRPTSKQVEEILVALDQYLESGKAISVYARQPTHEEVSRHLDEAGLTSIRCGLNADWSSEAWYLGPLPGHRNLGANRTPEGLYLLATEDEIDGQSSFVLVKHVLNKDDELTPSDLTEEAPLEQTITSAKRLLLR